ncbi:MAG: rhomboid family intramembrane serine protease [Pseudomonadota bacterium]
MDFLTQFPITSALIGANLVASLLAFSNPAFYEQNLFRVGNVLKRGEWHRILTSGFLHTGATHLLFNMLTLYFFGPALENLLGAAGYLIVYFGSLLGAGAWMVFEKRRDLSYSAVGASGAVSGVILAYCLFYPFYPFSMLYLIFAIPIPAIVFGVGFLLISFYLSRREGGMIAHGAHLGGALAGLVLTVLVAPEALTAFMNAISGA